MEHIHARIFVCELENPSLCLTLNDGVSEFRGRQAGTRGIVLEEVGVQVEGVDKIEFKNVHKIHAYALAYFDLNRMILIIEGDPVDRIKIISIVEVNVDAVHHHDHLFIDWRAATFGVNDERAVEAFGDMTREWEHMAMIEMQAKWFSVEFIDKFIAGLNHSART